ncbi:RecBCD enzyme subunit RecC [Vibrio aerogenes CECT 7868]|uniref:RecBCD enzyme subunit RecC n=1 Tax=Vibrio aerogenes CECT 7868 TaxID=1216006 RepID=A0A1M5WMG8_9VIBR|nr:exodeoxyribonuclease V subunit gamma [Vibrio aerogenes]SHH88384.1 RecBCD enzyme subunit RecC [Vibrio aerogenes CECT 7868]
MFTVYHSNQLDTLKIILLHLIRNEPLAHPFDTEQILVQSSGMSQWLKMALAEEFGVAANLAFPLPAAFIWELYTSVLPDVPQRSAFNKNALIWKIMQTLPHMLDMPQFQPLQQYLEKDGSDLKCYQLAEKIADIFDGYLVYRADWVEKWEAGEVVAELKGKHEWQSLLWQRLYQETLSQGHSHYHRANLYQTFIESLQKGLVPEGVLPKRLFIFGITALPPHYLEIFNAIGAHIDVHLMLTNPCRYYWGDIRDQRYLARLANKHRQSLMLQQGRLITGKSGTLLKEGHIPSEDELHLDLMTGNSLLASMGKLGRDHLYLLSQLECEEHEFFIEAPRDSLLHQIQADILHLEMHQNDEVLASSQHKQRIHQGDYSLSVHVCHSAMREVEVLHDALLTLFDTNPDLKPRDMIVMVADINTYSPAIEAVFGNAPGERFIPFSISDRTADRESPVLQAFLRLIQLPESRCLSSELLELLETPAMMGRFDISEAEFEQARSWVKASGIRWGLNEETARTLGLPATHQNTWEFGIERMLSGYAMSHTVDVFEYGSWIVAPFNEVQGLEAVLAGKLAAFISRIRHYRTILGQPREIHDWRQLLNTLLDDFFAPSVEEEVIFQSIRDTLARMNENLDDAGYDRAVSAEVMVRHLTDQLSGVRGSQRFLAGQVNFCTLMPMRSIPFSVVCLLGMNDGIYPRNMPAEGFDLIAEQPRPGDRSRRDDDRYLFLEALLSARERLYISYVGQSVRDNSSCQPSVLVTELMEYCCQNYCLSGDEDLPVDLSGKKLAEYLTIDHAMVPYSRKTFSQYPGSYAREWLPVARGDEPGTPAIPEQLPDYLADLTFPAELDLSEFQRFWHLPVKYFFNRRLRVVFESSLLVMDDEEPFALNGLESYQLRDELVAVLLEAGDKESSASRAEDYMKTKRAQGLLPVGAFGELEFANHLEQANQMVDALRDLCREPLPDQEVNLLSAVLGENRGIRIVGWISRRYQSGLVRYRSGKVRSQDYLAGWIEHLMMAAMGCSCPTHLIGYEKKAGIRHLVFDEMNDAAEAMSLIDELLALYLKGMNQPLPYFPKTVLAGVEANMDKQGQWQEDNEKAAKKMAETFLGNLKIPGECDSPYISRVWPEWSDTLSEEVQAYMLKVMKKARLHAREAE